MNIPVYQIDAFTNKIFTGNPAAVCPLDEWLEDSLLLSIAQENNLSETAFFVQKQGLFHIRWFTPLKEVDLCGHATLAAAYVIFHEIGHKENTILFHSKSGELSIKQNKDIFTLNFPSQPPTPCTPPDTLLEGLGVKPQAVLAANDYMAVYQNETEILDLQPDMEKLKNIALRGVIVTARGKSTDFVCRFFAPKLGINEDPVTGSAYCALAPYWAFQLKKQHLHSLQLSKRGGEISCSINGERTFISGKAVKFMKGNIFL
ncbi:MAG: PhzF family phenazine biosynthesis protein [Candidatus Brocadiaceae bacterium]|nr:PhzF family phenazine biosynthesis protein [Candidatus Brocadiaceae bacterium]